MNGDSNRRPVVYAALAAILPGVAIALLGFLLLSVQRDRAFEEVAALVDNQAEQARRTMQRILERVQDELRARQSVANAAAVVLEGECWFRLFRRSHDHPWALADTAPVAVELEAADDPLDQIVQSFLPRVERDVFGEAAAAEAPRFFDRLLEQATSPRTVVELNLGKAGAIRRLGHTERAVSLLQKLYAEIDPAASLHGIPLSYSLASQIIELLQQSNPELATARARELLVALDRDEIALPAGRLSEYGREAMARFGALTRFEPKGALLESTLTARQTVERLLAQNLPLGFRQWQLANGQEAAMFAELSGDRLDCAVVWLTLDRLEQRLQREFNPPELGIQVRLEPQGRLVWDAPFQAGRILPEVPAYQTAVGAGDSLIARRLKPWQTAVFAGVTVVLIATGLCTWLAVRGVGNRLKLARLRSEMVTSISHELRTPLTSMLLNLELLEDPRTKDELRTENTERVKSSAERLKRMVDRVLDFSEPRETLAANKNEVSACGILQAAVEEMKPFLGERKIEWEVERALPDTCVDRDAMVQVVTGLLDNVCKYTPAGSTLFLRAWPKSSDRLVLEIEDQGPGVPELEREHLFEPFFRSAATAARSPGVGLGLSMARRLVEEEGGRIRIEAANPGRDAEGLRVIIELPTAAVESTA